MHRYYDPATRQFLSVDPLAGVTGQPYVYAGDNPVNWGDPSGLAVFSQCSGTGNTAAACDLGVLFSQEYAPVSGSGLLTGLASAGGAFVGGLIGAAAANPFTIFGGALAGAHVGQTLAGHAANYVTSQYITGSLYAAANVIYIDVYASSESQLVKAEGLPAFESAVVSGNNLFIGFERLLQRRLIGSAVDSIVNSLFGKLLNAAPARYTTNTQCG